MVTINKLHINDPQMFGAIVKDLVSWRPGGRGLFASELTSTTIFEVKL